MKRCLYLTACLGLILPLNVLAQTATVDDLMQRINRVNDANTIERLHNTYSWHQDYMLDYAQVDLVSDAPSEFRYKLGVYTGKDGAKRVWVDHFGPFSAFADMPVFGAFRDHHQAQGIITLAADGQSARARFRTSSDMFVSLLGRGLASGGQITEGAHNSVWYENEYIREDGIWKMNKLQVCIYAEGALGSGYADLPTAGRFGVPAGIDEDYWLSRARLDDDSTVHNVLYPENPIGPDRVETLQEHGCGFAKNQTMIRALSLPFHFPNPVSGETLNWENRE